MVCNCCLVCNCSLPRSKTLNPSPPPRSAAGPPPPPPAAVRIAGGRGGGSEGSIAGGGTEHRQSRRAMGERGGPKNPERVTGLHGEERPPGDYARGASRTDFAGAPPPPGSADTTTQMSTVLGGVTVDRSMAGDKSPSTVLGSDLFQGDLFQGDKSPSTVLFQLDKSASTVLGEVDTSDDSSDHFFQGDPVYDVYDTTSDEASESSVYESLSDSDASLATPASRPSKSNIHSDNINLGCMILVSFLLILSSPVLLSHLFIEPLALLWTMAVFISGCIIFLIFILSPTIYLSTVPVALAIVIERFVGSLVGFLVMHIATGCLACMLGYVYAERLQHITPPTFLKEEDDMDRIGSAAGFGFVSLLLATVGLLPLWFGPMEGILISVIFLLVLEGVAIFSWVAFVARFMLHDAFLSANQLGNIMLCYICPYVAMSVFLLVLLTHFGWTGQTIGAMPFWFLMLSIAGLLGYELSVHAQWKQIMLSRRAPELWDEFSSAAGESPTAATTLDDKTRSAAAGESPTVAPPVTPLANGTATPAVEPAIPDDHDAVPQQEHHVLNRSPPQPEEEDVAEVINEVPNNVAPVVATTVTPVLQEEAPKKLYTSIFKVMKEVPLPASAPPTRPAPPKPEQQSPSAPTVTDVPPFSSNLENSNILESEVDAHAIYVSKLPLNATESQLEDEFKKFGTIKQNGIQIRSNNIHGFCYGFVEFEDSTSAQSAIEASPVTIGGCQCYLDEKRTPGSRGPIRGGRFAPGRGNNFRSEGTRGRGNYSGGRACGRGEFWGRSGGRGGSACGADVGYQRVDHAGYAGGRGGRTAAAGAPAK